jgi:hypothetical protein
MYSKAIVRGPGRNFAEGITTANLGKPDFEKALEQHSAFHLKSGLAYFGKGNFISAEGFSKVAGN